MPVAEEEVDRDRVERLLAAGYADLAGRPLRLLGVGWDNTVWLVDGRWTVRFPRRASALPLLEREVAVLAWLAGLDLPLPLPRPTRTSGPVGDYPWPSWAGPVVPGVELADAGPADGDRGDLGAAVGAFLGRLHATTPPDHLSDVLVTDPNGRADMSRRVAWGRDTLARVRDLGLLADEPDGVEDLFAEALALAPTSGPLVPCHGDLHLRHVLVDPTNGHASGVIDWGDACLADPALDLAFGWAALAGEPRARFLTAYADAGGPPVDRAREVRARVLALGLCAMLAATAHEGGSEPLRTESLRGIGRALG